LISAAVLLWSLASGASGLATSFAVLLIARCLVGVGEGGYGPVAPAILSDHYPVAVRGQVLGWFYMAIPLGTAMGLALGGQLAAWDPPRESWRWAFYAVVVPGVLLGLAALAMHDPPRGAADAITGGVHPVRWKDYRVLVRTRSYMLNMWGMTAMLFGTGAILWWMPEYLESHGATVCWGIRPTPFFGLLTAVAGLSGTWGGAAAADLLRRWFSGSYFLVSGVGLLIAAATWLLFLGAPFPQAWIFLLVTEFFLFFNTGPAFTIIANVTHPALRPTAYAWHILVIHLLGDALSPPLVGALADHCHGSLLAGFIGATGFLVLGGVLWLWGARYLHRDMLAAPISLDEPEQTRM
jgi:predicted MFS family arabinose efflux permease